MSIHEPDTHDRPLPDEVRQVHELLLGNAREAQRDRRADPIWAGTPDDELLPEVSCYYSEPWRADAPAEWRLGAALEGNNTLIYLPDEGKWQTRRWWDGETSPYSFEKACADARIWFTG